MSENTSCEVLDVPKQAERGRTRPPLRKGAGAYNMKMSRKKRTDSGMTLPEVITASAILLVCLTALATLLAGAINSSQTAKLRDEAANLANARIEAARTIPYDSVGVRYATGLSGDPAGEILTPEVVGRFTVDTICTWVRDAEGRAAYKKFTVRVSWSQPSNGHVDVTTMIYGKSNITGTGDMVVKLRYRETGLPVVDSSVAEVDAHGVARGVMTDNKGEAFFAQLPVGPAVLTITPPAGYLVDTTSVSEAQITADALTTLIIYVQRPATTTIQVRNAAGSPVSGATVVMRRADGQETTYTANSGGDVILSDLLYAEYSVTCSAAGYTSATLPLVLSAGSPGATMRFTMISRTAASLVVRVRDANGTQIEGATVHVKPQTGGSDLFSQVTGTNGEVSFPSIDDGTYLLVVEKTGYSVEYQLVYVSEEHTISTVTLSGGAKGNMQVHTLDKNGHAASLRVIISGPGYYRDSLYSSTSGLLSLTDLPVGSYEVSCYDSPASVATAIIVSGQTADVTVSQSKK